MSFVTTIINFNLKWVAPLVYGISTFPIYLAFFSGGILIRQGVFAWTLPVQVLCFLGVVASTLAFYFLFSYRSTVYRTHSSAPGREFELLKQSYEAHLKNLRAAHPNAIPSQLEQTAAWRVAREYWTRRTAAEHPRTNPHYRYSPDEALLQEIYADAWSFEQNRQPYQNILAYLCPHDAERNPKGADYRYTLFKDFAQDHGCDDGPWLRTVIEAIGRLQLTARLGEYSDLVVLDRQASEVQRAGAEKRRLAFAYFEHLWKKSQSASASTFFSALFSIAAGLGVAMVCSTGYEILSLDAILNSGILPAFLGEEAWFLALLSTVGAIIVAFSVAYGLYPKIRPIVDNLLDFKRQQGWPSDEASMHQLRDNPSAEHPTGMFDRMRGIPGDLKHIARKIWRDEQGRLRYGLWLVLFLSLLSGYAMACLSWQVLPLVDTIFSSIPVIGKIPLISGFFTGFVPQTMIFAAFAALSFHQTTRALDRHRLLCSDGRMPYGHAKSLIPEDFNDHGLGSFHQGLLGYAFTLAGVFALIGQFFLILQMAFLPLLNQLLGAYLSSAALLPFATLLSIGATLGLASLYVPQLFKHFSAWTRETPASRLQDPVSDAHPQTLLYQPPVPLLMPTNSAGESIQPSPEPIPIQYVFVYGHSVQEYSQGSTPSAGQSSSSSSRSSAGRPPHQNASSSSSSSSANNRSLLDGAGNPYHESTLPSAPPWFPSPF